jgi:REP-associated tyrosine transposase
MPGTHTNLLYHLVFSTKRRIPLINSSLCEELYRYLGGIIRGEGGVSLQIGGMPDHVHLLVRLKPTIALSDLLRQLKANSSKWVNETRKPARKFGWQDGYAAFTVSESQVARVAKYLRDQEQHHQRADFASELVELLRRHGVEYDEQYLWD